MKEKTKIRVHKIIWLAILLLIIFIPIFATIFQPELELVDDNCYINEYYTYLDETSVDIELIFNRNVNSGYATISFYDSSNNLLETEKISFYAYNERIAENSYTSINGKVSSYQIISYDFQCGISRLFYLYYLLTPVIIIFISSLFLNYKEYNYKEKLISIYAGWYHHTLRIDGTKYDEHNTLTSFTPIKLSTTLDDNSKLEATITLSNRITLKVNDKLIDIKSVAKTNNNENFKNIVDDKKSIDDNARKLVQELAELEHWKETGRITQEEYEILKNKILEQ